MHERCSSAGPAAWHLCVFVAHAKTSGGRGALQRTPSARAAALQHVPTGAPRRGHAPAAGGRRVAGRPRARGVGRQAKQGGSDAEGPERPGKRMRATTMRGGLAAPWATHAVVELGCPVEARRWGGGAPANGGHQQSNTHCRHHSAARPCAQRRRPRPPFGGARSLRGRTPRAAAQHSTTALHHGGGEEAPEASLPGGAGVTPGAASVHACGTHGLITPTQVS